MGTHMTMIDYLIKLSDLTKMIMSRGLSGGCSDLDQTEEAVFTPDEWKELCKSFHIYNGDPETFEERTNYILPDFAIIDFYLHVSKMYFLEMKKIGEAEEV